MSLSEEINLRLHRLLQWLITAMLAIILFFVRENYNDFRKMQADLQHVKDTQITQGDDVRFIDNRVTKLEQK